MSKQLDEFLKNSKVAEKIKTTPQVVLQTLETSSAMLEKYRQEGKIILPNHSNKYHLMIDNQLIAEGVMIQKQGQSYFKITKMLEQKERV
ncbi:MAG: hypothetical protein MJB14_00625 [Spirochaetes bacterium]|nr:hypothetical protein [Spirochaetota bacterium]